MSESRKPREITGKHVLIGTVLAFSVIIGVNITMAVKAVSTFPGLEVKNSYVASQQFDANRAAQEALGWTAGVTYANGDLILSIKDADGRPARAENVSILVGRHTSAAQDATPDMAWDGRVWRAPVALEPGRWMVRLEAVSTDGTTFRQRLELAEIDG